MNEYIHSIMSLPEPLREEIFLYYDQQRLSRAMCAMTPVPDSDEATLFCHYIAKYSKMRLDALHPLLLRGIGGITMPNFDDQKPNFICLPKVPRSQQMVGPRSIDNRPAWLTTTIPRDFVCIQQSSLPLVRWKDREWGIPLRPLPPAPINDGWGPQPHIEAYKRMHRHPAPRVWGQPRSLN
jgi:hypothetical protein